MKLNLFLKNLLQFYKMVKKDHPRIFLYTILNGIFSAIMPLVFYYFSTKIIDNLIASNFDLAWSNVLYLILINFILGLLNYILNFVIKVISQDCGYSVWQQSAHKSFILEYEQFEKTEIIDLLARASQTSLYSGGISAQIIESKDFITSFFKIIFSFLFIVSLFMINGYTYKFIIASFFLLLIFMLFIVISIKTQYKISSLNDEIYRSNEHYSGIMSYLLTESMEPKNGKDIRLSNMHELLMNLFSNNSNLVIQKFESILPTICNKSALLAFLTQLLAAVAYIYIGVAVLEGIISIGSVLLYTGALISFATSLCSLFLEYNNVSYRFDYLLDYDRFNNLKNMHDIGSLPVEKRDDYQYEFEFKNVSFKYPGSDNYVLKNINFKFNVGGRFALVGVNGAGKSTIVKLLTRLYQPTSGEILLNGININKYDYEELTSLFSIVFQDFVLFAQPVGQNIAASYNVDEEKCWVVLEKIGLKEKVLTWENKLDTLLYKDCGDGIEVSGGEAQKIAMARALYKNAPFVILDEPTASLDPLAEAEIYEDFNEIIGNKTALFISHRMSTCRFSNWIIVLDKGEIVQQGHHNDLIKQSGLYSELWNAQAQYYI